MRGLCVVVLAVLTGCAASQPDTVYEYEYAVSDYAGLRGDAVAEPQAGARLRLDMTLLDVEEELAMEVLDYPADHGIVPVARTHAVGELLALRALAEKRGEVLRRPSAWVGGESLEIEFRRQQFFIGQTGVSGDRLVPCFIDSWQEGVRATVRVDATADGWHGLTVESHSEHCIRPLIEFSAAHKVIPHTRTLTPEIVAADRVAVETIRPGHSACFFLSRAGYEEGHRVRLLIVHLVDTGE
ncbi:MAG: hypothetical protein K8I27_01180 [Planctomycetes bacterium]|nr:hypothetical protein [Planctomycetota bacterium]